MPWNTVERPPVLREARFEDYPLISVLESAYRLGGISYDEWRHLWTENPACRGLRRWPVGWVLDSETEGIVGSIGNVPLSYELEGRRLLAATGRCWVVHPRYRGFALELLDKLVNQAGIDLYVNTTVTAVALKAFTALQCARMQSGSWDRSAFWITSRAAFASKVLRDRSVPSATTLGYPLSVALRFRDWLKTWPRNGKADYEIEVTSSFDERFDTFWEELRRMHRRTLLAVRTREALVWHFKYALMQHRAWIVTAVRNGRLAAYALLDRRDNPDAGLKRMRIVDFQSLDGAGPLVPVVSRALKICQSDGVHVLEDIGCWLHHRFRQVRLASYRRKLPCWTFYYRAHDPALIEHLRSPDAWNASTFDGDASL